MKLALLSLVFLMVFFIPSYAGFCVPPAIGSVSVSATPREDEKPEKKDTGHTKETAVFGIVSLVAIVIGCIWPVTLVFLALTLGVGITAFDCLDASKKSWKIRGLVILGIILGAIAIHGGVPPFN